LDVAVLLPLFTLTIFSSNCRFLVGCQSSEFPLGLKKERVMKDDDFEFYTRGAEEGEGKKGRQKGARKSSAGGDDLTRKAEEEEFEFATGRTPAPASADTKVLGAAEKLAGEPTFAWLVIVEGDGRGIKLDIFKDQNIIGRGEECHIRLDDSFVSELHAIVAEKDGVFHIWDLGSKNGTKLNGEPLRGSSELKDGDVIEIGKTKLVFKKV
jgi:hypothetical protein